MKRITVLSLAVCVFLLITYTEGLKLESPKQDALDKLTGIEDLISDQSDNSAKKVVRAKRNTLYNFNVREQPTPCREGCKYSKAARDCKPLATYHAKVDCKARS